MRKRISQSLCTARQRQLRHTCKKRRHVYLMWTFERFS